MNILTKRVEETEVLIKERATKHTLIVAGVTTASCGLFIALGRVITGRNAMQFLYVVFPLVGVWVGTFLAYYFAKETFKAAERATESLRVLESEELISPTMPKLPTARKRHLLESLPVRENMIFINQMFFKTLPDDQNQLLSEILRETEKPERITERMPILSNKHWPLYVVHRSVIEKYVATQAMRGREVTSLTLHDLITDNEMKDQLRITFSTVSEHSSLGDAKDAMEQYENIQDVFVTEAGARDAEVRGWITDNIIQDNLS